MTVNSLDTVLAYVGATGSTSISFILPGLFYYKISSPDSIHQQRLAKDDDEDRNPAAEGLLDRDTTAQTATKRAAITRWLALGLAMYGALIMVTCLITNTFFLVAH